MVIILHIIVDTMLPFTLADNLAKAVKKPEVGHLGRSINLTLERVIILYFRGIFNSNQC